MLQQPIPNTSITVIKVDANTVKVALKDFKFGELVIGDITANCKATLDKEGDDFDLNGQTTLTVAALGTLNCLLLSKARWMPKNWTLILILPMYRYLIH